MGSDRHELKAPEIERRLTEFIRGELLSPDATVERNDDLLSNGLLDSVAVLRLAAWVAEEFEFEIQPKDFVIENFRSVVALTEYVQRATGQAG